MKLEYALLCLLIASGVVFGISHLGKELKQTFEYINEAFEKATKPALSADAGTPEEPVLELASGEPMGR